MKDFEFNEIEVIMKVDGKTFYKSLIQKELCNGSMLIESLDQWVIENIVEFGEE